MVTDTGRRARLRKKAGSALVDNLFRGLAYGGSKHPRANPARHGIEVFKDIPYRDSNKATHRLDIYCPPGATPEQPLPVVFYVHGGGFRILSKDTHWLVGSRYARAGFLVVNISYRLAPKDPFPAAVDDVCEAYCWVQKHVTAYGGDPTRILVAGESAGGNLVTGLAICATHRRVEPFAKRVWDTGVVPSAVVAIYPLLEVSRPERFWEHRHLAPFYRDRISEISEAYFDKVPSGTNLDLADPIVFLERHAAPERPLPPFFVPVGTADPLVEDTRRLESALRILQVPCVTRYYPREGHAFHMLPWRRASKACWADMAAFMEGHR